MCIWAPLEVGLRDKLVCCRDALHVCGSVEELLEEARWAADKERLANLRVGIMAPQVAIMTHLP